MITKPNRVEVPLFAALGEVFPATTKLLHDLQEGDVLCETCKGTGLRLEQNQYGLQGDDAREHFPYRHQTLVGCEQCCNGIRRRCPHCQKLLNRFELQHLNNACPGQQAEQDRRRDEAEAQRREGLPRITLAEYTVEMVYDADLDDYVSVDSMEPGRVYFACRESKDWVAPDADDVLDRMADRASDAVEDGADMVDVSDEGKQALQVALDKWFEEHVALSTTYWADDSLIVVVPEAPEAA